MATERRPGYAPHLDGVRAVSVAAVAWSHWVPAWQFGLPFGAGVHLFFVLSGFLITRILLGLRGAPDRPSAVGRFFLRRAMRLFPAFYVVLVSAWLAGVPLAAETWAWHAAYLSNGYIAWQGVWQGHFSHYWSLAVEEQFYLLWPWAVVWLPERRLPWLFAATVLLGPLSRGIASAWGLGEAFWALVPGGSADSLGVGALIAWRAWTDGEPSGAARPWARRGVIGGAIWLALAVPEWLGYTLPAALAVWRQVAQAGVFAWVVWRAARGWPGAIGQFLGHPVVVAIGRISYGIYLVHPFAPIVLDGALAMAGLPASPAFGAPLRALAAWTVSVALATVLWHVVEAPWHRLKARLA